MSKAKYGGIATAVALVVGVIPLTAAAPYAPTSSTPTVSAMSVTARGPIMVKQFWSSIIKLFISISGHASTRMVQRGVTEGMLKRVLNDGKVHRRSNGVTYVRGEGIEVRVNSKTGNVITVVRLNGAGSGGGGGGGGGA